MLKTQSGVAAVEFAFMLIVLLIIVAGIVEFGRAFWYYNAMAKASRDGARYMSTAPAANIHTVGESNALQQVITEANAAAILPGITAANVSITCNGSPCVDDTVPTYVTVAISYNITIGGLIPFFLPTGGVTSYASTLSPYTTMRYMK